MQGGRQRNPQGTGGSRKDADKLRRQQAAQAKQQSRINRQQAKRKGDQNGNSS